MNFGAIINTPCENVPPPLEERCQDPAFAAANPHLCQTGPRLTLKPGKSLICILASLQMRLVEVKNGIETDVTDRALFFTSSPNVAVIGAKSGNVTGLRAGSVTITATYNSLTATGVVTVIAGGEDGCCCSATTVATMVLVDVSKSMGLQFGGEYPTRLDFAKAAAIQYLDEVNAVKDTAGLISFTDTAATLRSEPVEEVAEVSALVPGLKQTQQKTTFFKALELAIAELDKVDVDLRVIVLVTDGEDVTAEYAQDANPILSANSFKSSGGIILCVGARANGAGFNLLNAISTGGFFVNGTNDTADAVLGYVSGLKGYLCGGNCTPDGDFYLPSGELNYRGFQNWIVEDGNVDLLGNGFLDLIPNNGLYVDLAGSSTPHHGEMQTRTAIPLVQDRNYTLKVKLAGNQRVTDTPNSVRLKLFSRAAGVGNPGAAPELGSLPGGGAIPKETYQYAYSYLDDYGETELSPPATFENEWASPALTVTCAPDAGASQIRIWRTTGSLTDNRFYLIGTADPLVGVFNDAGMTQAQMEANIAAGDIPVGTYAPEINTTGEPTIIQNQTITINTRNIPFKWYQFAFKALSNQSAFVSIQQTEWPADYPAIGLLLLEVVLNDDTNANVLFQEDFDAENMTYVPPGCGKGTALIGATYSYSGYIDMGPTMTDFTLPSGTVSTDAVPLTGNEAWRAFDDSGASEWWVDTVNLPKYIRYDFDEAKTITAYSVRSGMIVGDHYAPQDWVLEGSNNGLDWDVLDTRSDIVFASLERQQFDIASPASYLYYRLTFTA